MTIITTSLLSKSTGNTSGRAYRVCQQLLYDLSEYAIDQFAVFSGQVDDDRIMELVESLHVALLEVEAPMVSLHTADDSWFVGGRADDEQIYHLYTVAGEITTDPAEENHDANDRPS
jgi:hypothetical protein